MISEALFKIPSLMYRLSPSITNLALSLSFILLCIDWGANPISVIALAHIKLGLVMKAS